MSSYNLFPLKNQTKIAHHVLRDELFFYKLKFENTFNLKLTRYTAFVFHN